MSQQGRRKEKVKEKVCKDLEQFTIAGAHAFDSYKSFLRSQMTATFPLIPFNFPLINVFQIIVRLTHVPNS